jgi:hypothetical protein
MIVAVEEFQRSAGDRIDGEKGNRNTEEQWSIKKAREGRKPRLKNDRKL